MITLVRTYCWVCWWNNFKNLWTFGEVTYTRKKLLTDHMQKHFAAISFLLRRSSCVQSYCGNFSMATLSKRFTATFRAGVILRMCRELRGL